jgi:hypothetical protein
MDEGRKNVYLRIYSGVLRPGDEVQNARTRRNEKVARLFSVHANRRDRIERAGAGSIVVAMGLKEAGTGDTLCSPKAPILLERIVAQEPVISRAIEPKTQADKEKLDFGLAKLADEDPTFRQGEDPETGQTIIRGMGELHLDIMVDRLRREYGIEANVGRPQVVYRETVARTGESESRFERVLEDETLFGHARVRVSARPRGSGNELKMALVKHEPPPGAPKIPDPPPAILDATMEGRARGDAFGPAGLSLRGHRGGGHRGRIPPGRHHSRRPESGGQRGPAPRLQRGRHPPAGTHHAHRGDQPRAERRRRPGRPERPPRPDPGRRLPRQPARDHRQGPPPPDVRLLDRSPLRHPGPRQLQHAIRTYDAWE